MKVTKTYFMLRVKDMDRAVAFYRDVFQLDVRFASPDWSELTWRDATLALHGGGGRGVASGLGFEVDDLERACHEVKAAGGRVLKPPRDRPGEPIRLAEVADPEGNQFSLAQPSE